MFGPSSIYFCCLVCCLPLLGFVRCHQRMTAGGHSLPLSLPSFHRFGQESVCLSVNAPLGLFLLLLLRRPALIKHWSIGGGTACLPAAHHFPGCAPLNISTRHHIQMPSVWVYCGLAASGIRAKPREASEATLIALCVLFTLKMFWLLCFAVV